MLSKLINCASFLPHRLASKIASHCLMRQRVIASCAASLVASHCLMRCLIALCFPVFHVALDRGSRAANDRRKLVTRALVACREQRIDGGPLIGRARAGLPQRYDV